MERLLLLLAPRWVGAALLGAGLVLGLCLLLVYWRRKVWSVPLIFFAAAFSLAGIGGLAMPPDVGAWTAAVAGVLFFFMLLWLIITNQWSRHLAALVAAGIAVGLGGWWTVSTSEDLTDLGKTLAKVEVVHPWWLLCLGLIPLVIFLSFRSLAGLGTFRRIVAITLRSLLILFITLALAEVRLTQPNESVTVLFLIDRSLSVPPEYDPNANPETKEGRIDYRWERIKKFICDAVEKRGDAHKRDRTGVILFGRRARLDLPPSDAPTLSKDPRTFLDSSAPVDSNYTDIAAAIKLALASFPEGTAKRIVVLSDGNENLGNAEEQARVARQNGVEIDVVPLAAGQRNEHEVLVEKVEAPPLTEQGARYPINVIVRSYNPRLVKAGVTLHMITDGENILMPPEQGKKGGPKEVVLRPGVNRITFPPPALRPKGSFSYVADLQVEGVLVDGQLKPAPRGHPQNKRATTHVLALGQRRVLLVEAKAGDHDFLYEHLRGLEEKSKFRVTRCTTTALPADRGDLSIFLSNFDCIILANTPAELFTEDQQEVIRSNTADQGSGLIMVGGPEGFGAGGWAGTPVEKALPVDCDIKSMKVTGKGGLVLIFHASEIADGNMWQVKIGKLAVEKLSPVDMMGVLLWDYTKAGGGGTSWHIPFQTIGAKKPAMIRQIDKMGPGDMPDCNPSFKMALEQLTNPKFELAKKHVIFISDGDHWTADPTLLNRFRTSGITCTTVCVTSHGAPEIARMQAVATATGGKFHNVTNPKTLPEIYTKEVRSVSQSWIYDKKFTPKLAFAAGPADKLPKDLEPLYGFVRTTAKPSPLVEKPILGPPMGDQDFPILAFWQYGLGKSVAWTSDARSGGGVRAWDQDWADSPMYQRFWEQMVDYSLRSVETGKLTMTTEYKDGKIKVTVEARDDKQGNKPITNLTLRGGVTLPNARPGEKKEIALKLDQKTSGVYEAEFKADDSGSYFLNIASVGLRKDGTVEKVNDSVRGGVTVPYSPEFADMESNTALLDKLREITGGLAIADDSQDMTRAAQTGEVFRAGQSLTKSMQPIWFWLVLATAVVLFFDIGVRRIAIEPAEIRAAAGRIWDRLRGRVALADGAPQFLDRLRSCKEQVGEQLDKGRAGSRFEGGDLPGREPPGPASTAPPTGPTKPAGPQPGLAPQKEQEAADFASRLMKAKKKVWEERDKGKQ